MSRLVLLLLALTCSTSWVQAEDAREFSQEQLAFFESKIRPVLVEHVIDAAQLWSLQPLNAVDPPQVDGVSDPIDRFIRGRLRREGLQPADPAPPRVLLRRLYLELTGLPPTAEQVAAFEKHPDFKAVVDRLLDSPEFGERWARHWLDLTGYADTIGAGRSIPALEAWRYRDYVKHHRTRSLALAVKDKPAFTRGGSGRVQLGEWLTDPRNPLTARVWVNRVWHHLFRAGLVRTVDNFGFTGEAPSHPELLDHLASEFLKNGWSTKQLIRRIVLSSTWQQSSVNPRVAADRDPENRLLARANRRRLEAEVIRDSMLLASGQLDGTRGGPSLPLDVPGNLNPGGTGNMSDGIRLPDSMKFRRTIYLPQKRKGPFDALDFPGAFDLPDPNQETGRRNPC